MKNILIFGASGHARVVLDIIECGNLYGIAGLVDSEREIGAEIMGHKVLGRDEELPRILKENQIDGGIISVGDNYVRQKIYRKIKDRVSEFKFVTAIHPFSQIARNVILGEGTMVMPGVVINTGSKIGACCILNTNSSLDHDCVMEDFSSLGPGATVGGMVKIGCCSAVCLGADVIHGINIGRHAIAGAGTVVTRDIPDNVLALGVPARVVRKRESGEKYL